MLKFFPNGRIRHYSDSEKYYAHNGALTAYYYNPAEFYASLLIGLDNSKVTNLSFSYFSEVDEQIEDPRFSLSFNEKSQVAVTVIADKLYYSRTVELPQEILQNMQESIVDIYRVEPSRIDNPKPLLLQLVRCANTHLVTVKTLSENGGADLREILPQFIESLTCVFKAEAERLTQAKLAQDEEKLIQNIEVPLVLNEKISGLQ